MCKAEIVFCALIVMLNVRLIILGLVLERRWSRWSAVPLAWTALLAGGLWLTGCGDNIDPGDDDGQVELDAAPVTSDAPGADAVVDADELPAPPRLTVQARIVSERRNGEITVTLMAWFRCPDGAPDGPHWASFFIYPHPDHRYRPVSFTCSRPYAETTWTDNLPCGANVAGQVEATDPLSGVTVSTIADPYNRMTPPCLP